MKGTVNHLISYNTWANKRYAAWLSTFSEEDLNRELYSSFPTIVSTLGHIVDAQNFWTQFLTNENYNYFQWNKHPKEKNLILEILINSSLGFENCCKKLNDDDLKKKQKFCTPWASNELTLMQYIIHTVNHNTYHRGQVVSLAHQLGAIQNIPHTEFSFYMAEQ